MTQMQISRDDIVGLGDALDKMRLPDRQKVLLSAIVSLASESLAGKSKQAAVVDGVDAARSFRDQFASSFVAGREGTDDGSGMKIGHNPR